MTYPELSATTLDVLRSLEEGERERLERMFYNGDASESAWDSTDSAESHTLRQPSASAAIPARRRGLSVHRRDRFDG